MQEMVPTLEDCDDQFRLCLHERDFILGSFISLNIIQSIQKSRFTVLVLSKGFVQSQVKDTFELTTGFTRQLY